MKKLKTFEQMYSDPAIESELGNISREDDVAVEEFKEMVADALSLGNIDDITKALVKLRYKYQPKENTELVGIYNDAIKQWYNLSKELGYPSEDLQRIQL